MATEASSPTPEAKPQTSQDEQTALSPATKEALAVISTSEGRVANATKPVTLSILRLFNRTTST